MDLVWFPAQSTNFFQLSTTSRLNKVGKNERERKDTYTGVEGGFFSSVVMEP